MKALYLKTINENGNIRVVIDTDTTFNITPSMEIVLTDGTNDYFLTANTTVSGTKITGLFSINSIEAKLQENYYIKSPLIISIITDVKTDVVINSTTSFNQISINGLHGRVEEFEFELLTMGPWTSIDRNFKLQNSIIDEDIAVNYRVETIDFPNSLNPITIKTEAMNETLNRTEEQGTGKVYIVEDAPDESKIAIAIVNSYSKYWVRMDIDDFYYIDDLNRTYDTPRTTDFIYVEDYERRTIGSIVSGYRVEGEYFSRNEIQPYIPTTDTDIFYNNWLLDRLVKPYMYDDSNTASNTYTWIGMN